MQERCTLSALQAVACFGQCTIPLINERCLAHLIKVCTSPQLINVLISVYLTSASLRGVDHVDSLTIVLQALRFQTVSQVQIWSASCGALLAICQNSANGAILGQQARRMQRAAQGGCKWELLLSL